MSTKKLQIHSENILPIIKKWLYSERDIFIRELISNATDALEKLKVLSAQKGLSLSEKELAIHVHIDKEKKTLTISDTGIGMTEEEVEKYIAQIAFSGAQEFAEKYQKQDSMIGHFGLGFYSSYMVAKKVEIQTLSYEEGQKPVFWSCDGSSTYELEEGQRTSRGTDVILYLNEENEELLDAGKIESLLQRFCSFLPFPIYLEKKQINTTPPLWLKSPSECSDKEYLDFYRKLHPFEPDPLFWIHLQVDYPFHLQGILYFPKITKQFDFSKSKIQLFCNRVYVSDNCKDLLPDYLTMLRGAIDSPDIPLNVSRSYLQMDRKVRQLGSHISKKVADRLKSLYQTQKEKFFEVWNDIEPIVKFGVLQDEKFYEKVKDILLWKDLEGNYLSLEEYKTTYGEKAKNKLFYTQDTKLSSSLIELFTKQGIPVFLMNPFLDIPLLPFLEGKESVHFQRVDAALEDFLVDPSREKTLLEADGKSQAAHIAEFIRKTLEEKDLQVEAKSLASETLPAMFIIEEKERRMKDYFRMTQGEKAPFPVQKKWVVNTNHRLIQKLMDLRSKDPLLSQKIVKQLHDLSLLSQKELEAEKLPHVVQDTWEIFQELLEKTS